MEKNPMELERLGKRADELPLSSLELFLGRQTPLHFFPNAGSSVDIWERMRSETRAKPERASWLAG